MRKRFSYLLIVIIFIGAFLRFYKLDFGEGLYTHPDEYHIVASVGQLSFPNQMHPHFFSYGTAVIYPIYFTKVLLPSLQQITNYKLPITDSFLIGRFYSALFSTLTILIIYSISRTLLPRLWSLVAAALVALTPGLIQQAHFATPESALTFFLFVSLFCLLRFGEKEKKSYLVLASIFLGVALGVKVVAVLFLPVLLVGLSPFLVSTSEESSGSASWPIAKRLLEWCSLGMLAFGILIITFAIVSPFVILDYQGWRGSMNYESGVATGSLPVFYTRQFINTIPALFQLEKILPFALGPAVLLFGIFGIGSLVFIKKQQVQLFLLFLSFVALFVPNAFLFAKWTRFMAPSLPFFALFATLFLYWLTTKHKTAGYVLVGLTVLLTYLWTLAFFSIYRNHDIRVEASNWLESTVLPNSSFLVEGGNMVDIPLGGTYKKTSLDFYNMETDFVVRGKIVDALFSSDYFLVQSRRVFINHQRLAHLYPKTAGFYDALFQGKLGFVQVKEFHSYPRLGVGSWMLEVPDEGAEETWSVFDHPVIRVFKKVRQLPIEQYARFL